MVNLISMVFEFVFRCSLVMPASACMKVKTSWPRGFSHLGVSQFQDTPFVSTGKQTKISKRINAYRLLCLEHTISSIQTMNTAKPMWTPETHTQTQMRFWSVAMELLVRAATHVKQGCFLVHPKGVQMG